MAQTLIELGSYQEALNELEVVRSIAPREAQVYSQLGKFVLISSSDIDN
jgi:Flp pilus assembly protein TadD